MIYIQTQIDNLLTNPDSMENIRLGSAQGAIIGMLIQCNNRQQEYKTALENVQDIAAGLLIQAEDGKKISDVEYEKALDKIDGLALDALEKYYEAEVER